MKKEMDLYSDYRLSRFGQVTVAGLSNLSDGALSHDKITRLLSENEFNSKTLRLEVKPPVREYKNKKNCLTFDDTVVTKPYTDENDIICWRRNHSKGCNEKIGREKRQSPVTKNEIMRSMLKRAMESQYIKFGTLEIRSQIELFCLKSKIYLMP
jgi:hypothetical protein